MSDDIRIVGLDGRPVSNPEIHQDLVNAIRDSGDPNLLGDWVAQTYPKSAEAVNRADGGKITLDIREYLDALDARELARKIAYLKQQIAVAATPNEVRELIYDVIFPRGYRSASLPFWTVEIPAGTRPLYRVRAHMKDPSEVKNVADIWARPDGGSAGRVNRKGQRVLYLALATAHLAMVEAKANPGDYVAVSQFIATEPLILVNIRDMDSPVGLTIKQERKLKAMRDLFNWIFNYSGHDPDNPRYEAAQVVALDYRLVIPPAVGWGYHSALVDSPWAFNVAIDADRAKNLLRLVNTQVFYYEGDPNPRLIRHSSLIPAKKNVEPSTPLIPSLPTKFFWNPPPR